jgi:hypothetical protein
MRNLSGDAIGVICTIIQAILFIPFLYVDIYTDNDRLMFGLLIFIELLAIPAVVNQCKKVKRHGN